MGESGAFQLKGLKALIEYRVAGQDWRALPGPSSISDPGLEWATESVSNFAGTVQSRGEETIGEVTIESKWMPHHKSWKDLRQAAVDGSVVDVRWTFPTQQVSLQTGTQAAIATTGAVTFSKTGSNGEETDFMKAEKYDVGLVLEIGSTYYVVDTIDRTTGAVKVAPAPTTAVTAANVKLRIPSIRRAPSCEVRKIDEATVSGNGTITTQLVLVPATRVPDVTIGSESGIV